MPDSFESTLSAYMTFIEPALAAELASRVGKLSVLRNKIGLVSERVDELEKSAQFKELVSVTRAAFATDDYERKTSGVWEYRIGNFFRQTGHYQELTEQRSLDFDSVLARYKEAFLKKEVGVTYLAPIEFVEFAEREIELDDFRICSFSKEQLEKRLNLRTSNFWHVSQSYTRKPAKKLETNLFLEINGMSRGRGN
jgi:hypothetical protein